MIKKSISPIIKKSHRIFKYRPQSFFLYVPVGTSKTERRFFFFYTYKDVCL